MFAFITRHLAGRSISRLVENLPAQLRLRKSTQDPSHDDSESKLTSQRRRPDHSPERRFRDPSKDKFPKKKLVHPYLQEMRNDPTVWYHPDLYRPMSPEPDSPRPYNIGTPENWPPPLLPGYVGKRRNNDEASDYSGPWVSLPGAKKRRASWLPEQNSLSESLDLENLFSSEKNADSPSSPVSPLELQPLSQEGFSSSQKNADSPSSPTSPTWLPICYKDLMALEEALLAQEANTGSSPSTNSATREPGSSDNSLSQEMVFPMDTDSDRPTNPASETSTRIDSHQDPWLAQSSLPRSRSFGYPQLKTLARLPLSEDVRSNFLSASSSSNSNAVEDTTEGDWVNVERPKTAPEADLAARGIRRYSPNHGHRAPRPSKSH